MAKAKDNALEEKFIVTLISISSPLFLSVFRGGSEAQNWMLQHYLFAFALPILCAGWCVEMNLKSNRKIKRHWLVTLVVSIGCSAALMAFFLVLFDINHDLAYIFSLGYLIGAALLSYTLRKRGPNSKQKMI
jgi:peptidoglycan/LPS O-acetylase OafA/YrhL